MRHGIVPGLATYRLPRHIGMGAAREMMLLGETWDAARAQRQGLVNRVVPLEQLEATAAELARKLALNVRAASVATKRLVLRSYDQSLGTFLKEYVRAQRRCWNDRETRDILARYPSVVGESSSGAQLASAPASRYRQGGRGQGPGVPAISAARGVAAELGGGARGP